MNRAWLLLIASTLVAMAVASCAPQTAVVPTAVITTPPALDPLAQAAAEATAIMQQAQATALVLQAQAQATQLIEQAGQVLYTPESPNSTEATAAQVFSVQPTPTGLGATAAAAATTNDLVTDTPAENKVELLGVGFAAEGGFIIVNFRAPPSVVQDWWQGRVSVIDEASETVYSEIPVLPVIGPLIGRPVEAGQLGYVMLTHNPPMLQPGAMVTVILGEYKFEHVKIE